MSKTDRKCLVCDEWESAIRENQMICGYVDSETGELLGEHYGGRHHFVMTKRLQRDIDNEAKYLNELAKKYQEAQS